ncbi:sodium:solute symporter family protein [Caproiciproducens sp. R2]|uniref:sodium:solute symporter family protein n=1 Tax=Caproiciproducens sp. R2 TaxID=3435187 RepID=UPI004034AD86
MSSTQITASVIILLYMAATVAIGLIASRRKKSKLAKESNDDFLMAGKSLGPLVLAGTLFASNTGGASTTGIATNVYKYGLSASWYVIAGGIGFVLVSFIAPYFRKAQANTVPEIISKRYGKASHIFTAFTSITALFMATGAQIIATASIISVLTGIGFNIAAIISTVVVIVYTMIGGYKSVTAANLMHVLFITVGMGIAMFIMVNNKDVGGFGALFTKAQGIQAASGEYLNLLSMTKIGFTTIIGYIVMYFMTFPTGQEIVQTFCSAKDGKSAKLGSVLAGLVSAAFAIIPAIIGLIAYSCIDGYAAGGIQKNALAEATMRFAPPVVAGIVLAAIVAATISSASGNMIGTATMFTNDIFTPYINKGIKNDQKEIWISRVVMVIVGIVGLIIALTASNIISVMMSAFALRSAGPFAAFICGIFYKNVTKRAGFISIVVGTVVAAIWIYALHSPWDLSAMVPGGIVAFIAIFAISAIDKKMGIAPAPEIQFDEE